MRERDRERERERERSNYRERLEKQLDINLIQKNFIPTPKVYNKNEMDNDSNNFLKAHFKESINKDTDN